METEDIKNFLEQLKSMEEQLNSDNFDENFIQEVDSTLRKFTTELEKETQQPQQNNFDFSSYTQKNDVLIKVKRLHENAVIPSYSKVGDAGMDLTAVDIAETTDYISYKIGLAFEIPKGYVGLLFPRSSNSKKDLLLTNSVGVIDSGYRGEIEFRYKRIKDDFRDIVKYEIGDRVGQIMILPYPQVYMTEVPELSDSERGTGGFGSTGS